MHAFRVFAGSLVAVAATSFAAHADQPSAVKILLHGKTVSVITLPKPSGGSVHVQAKKVIFSHMDGAGVYTLSGDVRILLVQNGKQVMQITADEAELDYTTPTAAPGK
ncbi:MAG: hypothetical protein M3Y56_02215 [Armatimonadota bacterium]|nr:hypothetical protein [Armatimonadota bacterium]